MPLQTVAHVNFRNQARDALAFYHSAFGGELTVVDYDSFGAPEDPDDAGNVMWGQVRADNGFTVMAYDVQTARGFDRGERSFYISLRGENDAEVTAAWEGLSPDATVLVELGPSPWGALYGMLTDRFGITWVIDVLPPH